MAIQGMQYMGLTGGLKKRPAYLGNYIKNYASQYLYPAAEAAREKEQFEKNQAWEREKADKTEARERESMGLTKTYNEKLLEQQSDLASQQRLANERMQEQALKQNAELARKQQEFADRQNKISNITAGANLGISAVSALDDLGYDVIGGIGGLFKKGFDAISSWF